MPDLATRYLGLSLRSPLVASASPLSRSLEGLRRLQEVGAGAVVLYSLFEEQLRHELARFRWFRTQGLESPGEGLAFAPSEASFATDPEAYLAHFRAARDALSIPVIPSLNGATLGDWTRYAGWLQEAGAQALELNLYVVAGDVETPGSEVERRVLEVFQAVRETVDIPLAVKLSPFYSSLPHLARQLVDAGAQGLVLFNRFYQPDIDLESREAIPRAVLSTPADLRLPVRWLAMLYGRLSPFGSPGGVGPPAVSLAASGGILDGEGALKAILAGADVTMLCSLLLRHGVERLKTVEEEVAAWLEEHGYDRLDEVRGLLSEKECPDPAAFERGQYIRAVRVGRRGR